MVRRNKLLQEAASPFPGVELICVQDCLSPGTKPPLGNHFERQVYYQIYRHILARVADRPREVTTIRH